MPRLPPREMFDLVTAAETAGDDLGGLVERFDSGEQDLTSDFFGKGIMFFFIPKRSRHPATPGWDFRAGQAFNLSKQLFHCPGAIQGLLMTMAVDHDAFCRRVEFSIQGAGLNFTAEELIDN